MPIKRICVFLASVTLIGGIVSCGKIKGGPDESTSEFFGSSFFDISDPVVFEDADFGGRDLTFLVYDNTSPENVDRYIYSDVKDGDAISSAVAKRNEDTERKFKISIKTDAVEYPRIEAKSRIHSGQCDFDVIYELGTDLSYLALDGVLCSFENIKGIDLEKSYWIPSAKEDLAISGKTYVSANFISLNPIANTNAVFFNKTMYGDIGYPDSLYDAVIAGKWTVDKMVDIAISATEDIDGDLKMTVNDRYGFFGSMTDCLAGFADSSEIKNSVENPDGTYSLGMYNEKIVAIYAKFADKLKKKDNFITYDTIWDERSDMAEFPSIYEGGRFAGFGEGHALFLTGVLSTAYEFSAMKDDFGILPNPMYGEEQGNYCNIAECDVPMLAVPCDSADIEIVGPVLEYMAYYSERDLLLTYAEDLVLSMVSPDQADGNMIGVIKNSIRYEWTEMYNLTVTNSLKRKMMSAGLFKNVYTKYYKIAQSEIDRCVSNLKLAVE